MSRYLFFKRALFRFAPGFAVRIARLLSPLTEFELGLIETVVPRDRLAIDIGASWGMITYVLVRNARNVVAFEPNPEKGTYLNSVFGQRAQIVATALSDRDGESDLVVPRFAPAFATIERANPLFKSHDPNIVRIKVPLRRLDDFNFRNVGFIKVDVEGHELSVFRGAVDLLTIEKPILFVEIERRHNRDSFDRVFELLSECGYRAFFCGRRQIADIKYFRVERDQSVNNIKKRMARGEYVYNFLFVSKAETDRVLNELKGAGYKVVI